jgi:nitrogen fixation NifU-like protein
MVVEWSVTRESGSAMKNLDNLVEQIQQEVMEEARKRYSETVIDHWLNPRNPGTMEQPDGYARITGSCGDTMEIFLRVRHGKIQEANFLTDGCITSIVSGSMAVEMATGRDISSASSISAEEILQALGGLPEESEHCALLASNTLRAAVVDYLLLEREPWKRLYRQAVPK